MLPEDHIAVVNVRPAYHASLDAGVTPVQLAALGLPAEVMADADGTVPGSATYTHFDWMAQQGGYPAFVRASVERHTFGTLGIVGLACKTLDTIHEALDCHRRFQHLTNRTARYEPLLEDGKLVFRDHRWGEPRTGRLRVSEYTTLVAMQLLRLATEQRVPAVVLRTRRPQISPALREVFETFLEAPVEVGADHTELVVAADVLMLPVRSADAELAAYFQARLHRAACFEPDEPELLVEVRRAIQQALATGRPSTGRVARQLGMGARTLQRRLEEQGVAFGQVLEDTRRRLADQYLADADLTLAEVAYLCGYEEQTSFFRAFRQWTGSTPTARRAELLMEHQSPTFARKRS